MHSGKPENNIKRSILFATLPLVSFVSIFIYSKINGTTQYFVSNYTISFVDWIFIIFNFYIVNSIDWTKKKKIALAIFFSIVLSTTIHILWSFRAENDLLLYSFDGKFTFAAYVHLIFSAVEFFLMICFIINYKNENLRVLNVVSISLSLYFVASIFSSYYMWGRYKIDDVARGFLGATIIFVFYLIRLNKYKKKNT
ncbi:MAG: hypothetical protein JXN65_10225 [Clostridia bacterium]|nr:hypothetical protein [Clostridia bacterium]